MISAKKHVNQDAQAMKTFSHRSQVRLGSLTAVIFLLLAIITTGQRADAADPVSKELRYTTHTHLYPAPDALGNTMYTWFFGKDSNMTAPSIAMSDAHRVIVSFPLLTDDPTEEWEKITSAEIWFQGSPDTSDNTYTPNQAMGKPHMVYVNEVHHEIDPWDGKDEGRVLFKDAAEGLCGQTLVPWDYTTPDPGPSEKFIKIKINSLGIDAINKGIAFGEVKFGFSLDPGHVFRLAHHWTTFDPVTWSTTYWSNVAIRLQVTGYLKPKPKELPDLVPCPECPIAGPQNVAGLSRVITTTLSHVHDAVDYETAKPTSGCATCGAAGAPSGDLPALRIERFHRYRDIDWQGSFGPGVFSGYDLSLAVYPTERRVEFFDPHNDTTYLLKDANGNGAYYDVANRISILSLEDVNGYLTGVAANIRRANLLTYSGDRYYFDVFKTETGSSTNFVGRLTRIVDRNGNTITLTYLFPDAQATDAALGYDRTQLWRLASITDAYGEIATLTTASVNGRWVITSAALPNATTITYTYSSDQLIGVNRIDYPDGSTSTFTTQYDAIEQDQIVSMDDAAAEGIHRRKSLSLTTTQTKDASGVITPQPSNLAVAIRNGEQEVSFLAWTERSGGFLSYFIYGGGGLNGEGMLTRYDTIEGKPAAVYRAREWNIAEPSSTYTWDQVETYLSDTNGRLTGLIDASGRLTQYVRDPVTSLVISTTTYSDGGETQYSQSGTTYNDFRQPLSTTDALNRTASYHYDLKGNRETEITALGSPDQITRSWTYNARGQVLSATDGNGNTTLYTYGETAGTNDYRRLISISQPPDEAGGTRAVTLFFYDAAGRLTQTTDPGNRTATYGYDARNRQTSVTYQDGSSETWTYGSGPEVNLPILSKDRNGNLTATTFDLAGRKTQTDVKNPAGTVTVSTQSWTYMDGKNLVTSVTDNGDRTLYEYDRQQRRIASERNPSSAATLREETVYGDDQRVHFTRDPYGRRTYYLYDRNDQPARIVRELVVGGLTPPADFASTVVYLASLTRQLGADPAYVIEDSGFDVEGQQIARIDARGFRSTFEYDAQGRLKAEVAGEAIARTQTAVLLMDAARTEYGYDDNNNRTSIRYPRSFTRNGDGSFATIAVPYQTAFIYGGRNLLKSVTYASGSADAATVNYTYTLTGKKASESDPRNPAWTTTYMYSPCCDRLAEVRDAANILVASYAYDANGNVVARTDGNGLTTWSSYDPLNRVVSRTNPANETTTIEYGTDATTYAVSGKLAFAASSNGGYVKVTNPLSEVTVEVRDGLGRVVRTIDGNNNSTYALYDQVVSGLVKTTTTDALNNVRSTLRDGNGRSRQEYDELNYLTTRTFDANGNHLSLRNPNNVGFDVVNDLGAQPGYDSQNRLLKQTDTHQDSVSRTYDRHGNVLTTTDSLNKTTSYTYDYRDRKASMTDRVAGVTGYAYDQANHLTQITDADSVANGKTIYAFDNRGYLQSETFPTGKDGKKTIRTYSFDNAGRLIARAVTTTPAATPIPLNEITTYGYDSGSRLTSRAYNDGRGNDVFTYDKVGRLLIAVSGRYENSVVRSYTENAEKGGRLTSEKLTLGGTNAGSWKVSYKYDALNRLTDITYPTGEVVKRTYTARHQLNALTLASVSVATRSYDNGGRLLTTTLGNNLVETRTYRSDANGLDDQLATQSIPGVTSFTYTYDANKRIAQETNGLFAAQTQQFLAYDDENRLTSWKRGTTETQTWALSKVGDWTSTTINGVPQSRTHSAVHEVTAVAGVPLSYDLKGNVTQNQDGSLYGWDSENRLSSAVVTEPTRAVSDTAFYRYDALGRRVQKQVFGLATTYIHHGAQVVHEFDAKVQLPALVAGDDGDGSGTPPGGGILQGAGVTRINYQPSRSQIPSGFFADKGKVFDLRTNGKSYGWKDSPRLDTLARNQHPWPQFDTFNQCWLNNAGTAGTWEIALANGTYAVVVVMGDAASANQTNNLDIEGQPQTDPDPAVVYPPTYQYGDFDGYAVTAIVADGKLTLSVPATANNPKICFVEIGSQGSSITQADRDRLADAIADATAETGYGAFPKPQPTPRQYVYGSYVDEPLLLTAGGSKYYYASNRLYSVAAITSQAGQVVERYKYDAYGRQTILADNGVVSYKPSDYGNFVGFTGRYHDWETGLTYFRSRYLDHHIGKFLNRMPWQKNNKSSRHYTLSNYSLLVVDDESRSLHRKAIEKGFYAYIQDRYSLYDFADNNPSNVTEPYSTIRYEVDGSGGGISMPAPNGATLDNTVRRILELLGRPEEPAPDRRDFASNKEHFDALLKWHVDNEMFLPVQGGLRFRPRSGLRDIPWGKHMANGCEDVAKKIQGAIGGEVHRITPSKSLPGTPELGARNGTHTGWYHHDVVVKDGRVYDALTGPEGLPINEFKQLWEHADVIDFGF